MRNRSRLEEEKEEKEETPQPAPPQRGNAVMTNVCYRYEALPERFRTPGPPVGSLTAWPRGAPRHREAPCCESDRRAAAPLAAAPARRAPGGPSPAREVPESESLH
ncbi:hypothetical protein EYF80_039077 [Liparis tanakae]|uniref:Uncharacterized protein n=1 Tax=Liparis tanakae TaxID=230148 RepID=A0A4Z2GAW4_9TELE|nr:hypothetical protein EYF80_039077 [Liparis tanakae]